VQDDGDRAKVTLTWPAWITYAFSQQHGLFTACWRRWISSQTVVNASFGIFYVSFAWSGRDIPAGRSKTSKRALLSFPRLFYGDPTNIGKNFEGRGRSTVCLANSSPTRKLQLKDACINPQTTRAWDTVYDRPLEQCCRFGHAPIPAIPLVDYQCTAGLASARSVPAGCERHRECSRSIRDLVSRRTIGLGSFGI